MFKVLLSLIQETKKKDDRVRIYRDRNGNGYIYV